MNKLVLMSLIMIMVTACSTKKSNFVEVKASSESESVLYIYRPYSMSNIMITPEIMIDGEKVTDIKNSTHHYFFLPQGKHTVELEIDERYSGVQKIDVNLQHAKTEYLRVNTSLKFEKNKPYTRSFSFEMVEKETALAEIQATQYADKKKGVNKEAMINEKEASSEFENVETKDKFTIHKTRDPFSK